MYPIGFIDEDENQVTGQYTLLHLDGDMTTWVVFSDFEYEDEDIEELPFIDDNVAEMFNHIVNQHLSGLHLNLIKTIYFNHHTDQLFHLSFEYVLNKRMQTFTIQKLQTKTLIESSGISSYTIENLKLAMNR